MGEMQRPSINVPSTLAHSVSSMLPSMTTSYVVETVPGDTNRLSTEITWATLVYDPTLVTASTETVFYTSKFFGKGPDRYGMQTVPVYSTAVPVIPGSSLFTSIPTTGGPSLMPGMPTSVPSSSSSSSPGAAEATSTSHHGLSTGAVAGVAVGAAFTGVLIAALVVFLFMRSRQRRQASSPSNQKYHPYPNRDTLAMQAYKSNTSRSSSMTSFAKQGLDMASAKDVGVRARDAV